MAFGRRRAAQAQVAMADGGATPAAAQARGGRGRLRVAPDPVTEVIGERASNGGVLLFSVVLFALAFAAVLAAGTAATGGVGPATVALAVLLAALAVSACHIAQQWERVVVLRLGKFNRVSGPGLFWTWPVIESNTMRVDTRTRVTSFGAEETLTADLVPLDVNAVLFWHVWDARAACTEVGDFTRAVELAAQTALRDAIGRASVSEVAIRRNQLDQELQEVIEERTSVWGITVMSVEIRDIVIPQDLQEAMSAEAQAEREKNARMVLAEVEKDISSMLVDAANVYDENELAVRLRTMHLLYESVKNSGGTVVIPSAYSEGFADAGLDRALDSLKTGK